jgi:hypothetical protein
MVDLGQKWGFTVVLIENNGQRHNLKRMSPRTRRPSDLLPAAARRFCRVGDDRYPQEVRQGRERAGNETFVEAMAFQFNRV